MTNQRSRAIALVTAAALALTSFSAAPGFGRAQGGDSGANRGRPDSTEFSSRKRRHYRNNAAAAAAFAAIIGGNRNLCRRARIPQGARARVTISLWLLWSALWLRTTRRVTRYWRGW